MVERAREEKFKIDLMVREFLHFSLDRIMKDVLISFLAFSPPIVFLSRIVNPTGPSHKIVSRKGQRTRFDGGSEAFAS